MLEIVVGVTIAYALTLGAVQIHVSPELTDIQDICAVNNSTEPSE